MVALPNVAGLSPAPGTKRDIWKFAMDRTNIFDERYPRVADTDALRRSVIGNTTDFESVILGSSPSDGSYEAGMHAYKRKPGFRQQRYASPLSHLPFRSIRS